MNRSGVADRTKTFRRLPPIPSVHASFVRAHHHHPYTLDGSDQRAGHNMAVDADPNQWRSIGRCVALSVHAPVPSEPIVGKHSTFS